MQTQPENLHSFSKNYTYIPLKEKGKYFILISVAVYNYNYYSNQNLTEICHVHLIQFNEKKFLMNKIKS